MPNTNKPMGLRPNSRSFAGGPLQTYPFIKLAAYGTRIRPFDVVNQVASGDIERSITPGATLISGVSMNFGAASTLTDHAVITDPFQLYMAQAGGATGFAAADRGLNANITLASTNLDFSDDIVNDATEAGTATLDLRIHDKINDPDNTWGLWAKILVSVNSHRLADGTVGV